MKKIRRLQTQGEGPRMLALEPQMNLTHGLTPKRLRGILELADQGDILEQHLLFADMEDRCEHLAAEMGKRKRALLTLDWEILPGRANDARAARIAAAVREQFDAVNGFEDLLMDLAACFSSGSLTYSSTQRRYLSGFSNASASLIRSGIIFIV